MSYDWEKIFESKTNKELYEIYSGNSLLPNETTEYAKQELERRNFNFDDIEGYKSAWRLSDLIIEADRAQSILNQNQNKIIPYKSIYLLILGILVVYIVLLNVFDINLSIVFPIGIIGITLWYVPFTNRVYVKQKEEQEIRIKRINDLKEKLGENIQNDKFDPIKKDIVRNIKENNKSKKILNYMLIGIILIFLLIKIIGMIAGE